MGKKRTAPFRCRSQPLASRIRTTASCPSCIRKSPSVGRDRGACQDFAPAKERGPELWPPFHRGFETVERHLSRENRSICYTLDVRPSSKPIHCRSYERRTTCPLGPNPTGTAGTLIGSSDSRDLCLWHKAESGSVLSGM